MSRTGRAMCLFRKKDFTVCPTISIANIQILETKQNSRRQSTGPALNTVSQSNFWEHWYEIIFLSQNAGKKGMEELREDSRRKKSGMHVVYFTPLALCNFSCYNDELPYLKTTKITLYNFSNPFIWKSSLWYKSPHSEIMSTHKVHQNMSRELVWK